jgi:hypothetical protein
MKMRAWLSGWQKRVCVQSTWLLIYPSHRCPIGSRLACVLFTALSATVFLVPSNVHSVEAACLLR